MTFWNKKQGVDACDNCKQEEKSHFWVCECGRRLPWKDKLMPVDCVCGSPNATLRCSSSVPGPAPSQDRVRAWVRSTFSEHEARDVPERSLRMVEEAIELAQACKVDAATVHRLVDYVFSRPVGEPNQELAGCMVTLYALAVALDLDADTELDTEIKRINRPEVIERCRRRQHEKRAALVAAPKLPGGRRHEPGPTQPLSGLEGPKRTSAPPNQMCGWAHCAKCCVIIKGGLRLCADHADLVEALEKPPPNARLLGALDSGLNLAGHVEPIPAARMDAPNGPECACGRPSMHESGWCGTQCIGSLGVR